MLQRSMLSWVIVVLSKVKAKKIVEFEYTYKCFYYLSSELHSQMKGWEANLALQYIIELHFNLEDFLEMSSEAAAHWKYYHVAVLTT